MILGQDYPSLKIVQYFGFCRYIYNKKPKKLGYSTFTLKLCNVWSKKF